MTERIHVRDQYLVIAIRDIYAEMASADHRPFPTDPLRRIALICEESGEAIQAALDITRSGRITKKDRQRLYAEVRQCAALCLRTMAAMQWEGV